MNAFNQETEVDSYLWDQGQPGLHSEFPASQGYTVLKKKSNNKSVMDYKTR